MAKLVEIDACVDCPHYIEKETDQFLSLGSICHRGFVPFCCLENRDIKTNAGITGDFPDWCPLEEAE